MSQKDMLGIAVRMLVTLPATALGIVCDLLQKFSDPKWVEAAKRFLRKENPWPKVEELIPWPRPNEVFELTLDGDASENQPLAMVKADGYDGPWQHNGSTVKGRETRRFKLVEIGSQPNCESVKTACQKHGKIPEGQWREVMKKKFTDSPGRLVGIADASWVSPSGLTFFPYVTAGGASSFLWSGYAWNDHWLWLVEVE